jgi:uncharacterized protein YfkK (UPF0435 family)
MSWEWKHDKCLSLYKITEDNYDEEVCGVIRHKKYEKFNDLVAFKQLNEIALKLDILNKGLFDDAEYIRESRNKVHLVGLKNNGDFFSKDDVERIFTKTSSIINRIENKITDINS